MIATVMNKAAQSPTGWAAAEYRAEERVLADLINTLMAEEFLDAAHTEWLTAEWGHEYGMTVKASNSDTVRVSRSKTLWQRWWLDRTTGDAIVFSVRAAIVQPYRYAPANGVWRVRFTPNDTVAIQQQLSPVALMEYVVAHCLDEKMRRMPGVRNVLQLLETTLWQTAQSLHQARPIRHPLDLTTATALQALERRAAQRDRPFHPVAKAKQGLNETHHARYAAEFARPITMCWIAIRRDRLQHGNGRMDNEPMDLILTTSARQRVRAEMASLGLLQTSHLAIPVHPWQMSQGLPKHLPRLYDSKDAVALTIMTGDFEATSSLRSLAPIAPRPYYLKLPLAVFSLGAARYLPAVKLINGERGQAMLEQARSRDKQLAGHLYLCDERRWWSYMPEDQGLFDDGPRHLGVMIRQYPESLLGDPDVRLVPMAALGVPLSAADGHFFDDWLAYRGLAVEGGAVEALFSELCGRFFDIVLRLYRFGLMPEVHGQNAVLVWRSGYIDGLLLRDHDSVRLHPPWLARHDIDDPEYQIRPGYSNSLYNDKPSDLLFYLQTLGIQVNLFAIIETLADHFAIDDVSLWKVLHRCLEESVEKHVDFDDEQRETLRRVLFDAPDWPLKLLLRPLLEQQGVPGAMPSGKSRCCNPFRAAGIEPRTFHSANRDAPIDRQSRALTTD